jgi:hypothetical protein
MGSKERWFMLLSAALHIYTEQVDRWGKLEGAEPINNIGPV